MANFFPKQKRGFYEKSSQLSTVLQNLRSYQLATGDVSSAKLTLAREKFGDDDERVFAAVVKDTVDRSEGDGPSIKQHRRRKRKRKPKKMISVIPTPSKTPTSSSALSMLSTYSDSDDSDKLEVPPVIREMFTEDKSESSLKTETDKYKMCDQLGYFDGGGSSSDEGRTIEFPQEPSITAPSVPLSTYVCWKCNNVGHLPKDCTVTVGIRRTQPQSKTKLSAALRTHYDQCNKIKARKGSRCAECGIHSNLASCLECGVVLCDGRGHLASHLSQHSTHNTLYSHKLRRMLKCCKVSCDVVDIYELVMCSVCLGKAFTQHYSMISVTWSKSGLKAIPNALCCEEHFLWHRMNCPSSMEEHFVSADSLEQQSGQSGLVSEFFL